MKNLKEHNACEKDYVWNPSGCICENGKYIATIIDNSVVTCDEIINTVGSVSISTL